MFNTDVAFIENFVNIHRLLWHRIGRAGKMNGEVANLNNFKFS